MLREIPSTPEIVQEITRAAEKYGVSVSHIFRRADMPHGTFTNWKSGEYSPTLESLRKIYAVISDLEREHARELAE